MSASSPFAPARVEPATDANYVRPVWRLPASLGNIASPQLTYTLPDGSVLYGFDVGDDSNIILECCSACGWVWFRKDNLYACANCGTIRLKLVKPIRDIDLKGVVNERIVEE